MPQSTEEIVRKLSEGPEGMELGEFLNLTNEDATHHVSATNHPLAGRHRGREGLKGHYRRLQEVTGGHTAETKAVLVGGDYGAFLRHGRAANGEEHDYLILVRIQDGKLAESWELDLDSEKSARAFRRP